MVEMVVMVVVVMLVMQVDFRNDNVGDDSEKT